MKFVDAQGMSYNPTRFLTYNDVLLVPRRSRFSSRNDKSISLRSSLCDGFVLESPIISANMDTITGVDMAVTMSKYGGMGILHRFYKTKEEYIDAIRKTKEESYCWLDTNDPIVAFSVGCGEKWIDFTKEVVDSLELKRFAVCVDVAHGHMDQAIESTEKFWNLQQKYKTNDIKIAIISGNVATGAGAVDLAKAGANVIKVGIGGGSICSTRLVTGHGMPQLSAVISARESLNNFEYDTGHVSIIADGGLRYSGDIVKAVSAGADFVMMGQMLAGTSDSPGDVISLSDGTKRKLYRGQSSRHFLNDIGKKDVAAEGVYLEINYKGNTKDVVEEILGGIRSGMTYSGVGDLDELREMAEFIEITHNAWVESTPHAVPSGLL